MKKEGPPIMKKLPIKVFDIPGFLVKMESVGASKGQKSIANLTSIAFYYIAGRRYTCKCSRNESK